MKAKLKLDQKALQQFFLEHGEKIAFALIICGILWMVYEAVIHKGYEKVPNQLIESSETAKTEDRSHAAESAGGDQEPSLRDHRQQHAQHEQGGRGSLSLHQTPWNSRWPRR